MIRNWFEKKVDERQEKELLKVEHYSFWFMYWLLLGVLIIQVFIMEQSWQAVAGEFIVFMAASLFLIVGCIRRGVWSYQTRKVPGVKSYLLYSLTAAVLAGLPFGLLSGIKWHQGFLPGILFCVIFYMVFIFAATFVTYCIVGAITKHREKTLEQEALMEGEEDEME